MRYDEIRLYPNPNFGIFTITHKSIYNIILYDILGKVIKQENDSQRNYFDYRDLAAGEYQIILTNKNEKHIFRFTKLQ